jgi:unsaturated rhamnogalacturonyl hydrolase
MDGNTRLELLRKVALYTVRKANSVTDEDASRDKDDRRWIRWDWSMGVGFYGVLRAYERLKDAYLTEKTRKWVDTRLDKIENVCVNTCGVMPAVLYLSSFHKTDSYEALCQTFDDYVNRNALRTPCGAIAHSVIGSELPGEIWADTLFMAVLYMAKRGAALGNKAMALEARRQLLLHIQMLRDETSGLFFHGYDDLAQKPLGAFWGRGNAWVLAAAVEIMETPDIFYGEAASEKEQILSVLDSLLDALGRHQNPNGTFNTVINDRETCEEMSVTAGVAFGTAKGIRKGWVDKRHGAMGAAALSALEAHIDSSGSVQKGSTGTPIKKDALEYNVVPYHETPFTQGLALMALVENVQEEG